MGCQVPSVLVMQHQSFAARIPSTPVIFERPSRVPHVPSQSCTFVLLSCQPPAPRPALSHRLCLQNPWKTPCCPSLCLRAAGPPGCRPVGRRSREAGGVSLQQGALLCDSGHKVSGSATQVTKLFSQVGNLERLNPLLLGGLNQLQGPQQAGVP